MNKQQIIDKLRELGELEERNAKEWAEAGDKVNSAYRNGMAYAYQQALELARSLVPDGDYPLVNQTQENKEYDERIKL